MPRHSPRFLREAASENSHLPLLLRYCRDLPSARNELRWLKEHTSDLASTISHQDRSANQVIGLGGNGAKDGIPFRLSQRVKKTGDSLLRNSSASTGCHHVKCSKFTGDRISFMPRNQLHEGRSRLAIEEGRRGREKRLLARMVYQRSKGKPLQYILGNQPFGNLEIECREGVLIPRPETEAYTEEAAQILSRLVANVAKVSETKGSRHKRIRILDLCSGTGCIGLLLHSILKPSPGATSLHRGSLNQDLEIEILGLDMSERAINLARANLKSNVEKGHLHLDALTDIHFAVCDIRDVDGIPDRLNIETVVEEDGTTHASFKPKSKDEETINTSWDLVISNPPYISKKEFIGSGVVEKSVRRYEPRLALIPPDDEQETEHPSQPDLFYRLLVSIASKLDTSLLIMEVGDTEQANRVLWLTSKKLSSDGTQPLIETWRDDGSVRRYSGPGGSVPKAEPKLDKETGLRSMAAGETASDRVVVCWRDEWATWRRESP